MINNTLIYKIEGKTFKTNEQYITGAQLKEQGGIPLETELYLAVQKPFEHELIENDTRVNLARPDIEQFFVMKKLPYSIDGKDYVSYKQWISGTELREKGNVPVTHDLFLKVDEGWEDNFIEDDELIDLAMPGKEKFYTKGRECTIFVNTRPFQWKKRNIRYEEVLQLAFGNINTSVSYTVTYTKGYAPKEDGFLTEGKEVNVKHKMEFDATATTKS